MSAEQIDALLEDAAREREAGTAPVVNDSRRGSADSGHSARDRHSHRERDDHDRSSRFRRDRHRDHSPYRGRLTAARDRGEYGRLNGDDERRGARSYEHGRGGEYRGRRGDFYSGGGRARSRSPGGVRADRGDRFRPGGRGRDDREHYRSYRDREDRPRYDRDGARPRTPRRVTPEPTEDERDRRTVFVQQLAARLRTHELTKFFSKVGPVKEAQIVKDRVSNRSKGVGYVEFKDEDSVVKALELTGQKLAGIPIIVQVTEAEKNRQARQTDGHGPNSGIPFHRLYVGNIHFSISESDLEEVFKPFGELEFVQLQKEEGGRSKGYGFVQFVNAADAKTALDEMNGFEIAGRPIRVGLGNDKFTPESTQNLLRNFTSNMAAFQGSSFSGAGGRGAQAGGHGGTFDRAIARDTDRGTGGASALDDTDVGGVNFNNYSRESLMRKLASRDPSTADGLPALQNVIASAQKPAEYVGFKGPSRCIKIEDVFNPETETDPNWVEDIEEEIKKECETKWGKVLHIKLDPNSKEGEVWVMFEKEAAAEKAMRGLDGRLYNQGHHLRASPISEHIYRSLYGRALQKVL